MFSCRAEKSSNLDEHTSGISLIDLAPSANMISATGSFVLILPNNLGMNSKYASLVERIGILQVVDVNKQIVGERKKNVYVLGVFFAFFAFSSRGAGRLKMLAESPPKTKRPQFFFACIKLTPTWLNVLQRMYLNMRENMVANGALVKNANRKGPGERFNPSYII